MHSFERKTKSFLSFYREWLWLGKGNEKNVICVLLMKCDLQAFSFELKLIIRKTLREIRW